ncbi:protein export proteins SecD/SecF fusion [Chlamydia felis Fe/C-56]|uniref:Protein export proteins SecD/SecF fusion n=1 Tax=Chlamydia felis (strain Fe/C-56) TaxID=264202 RepID=Q253D8_CHLFF|nr:protein translocase subunit SecDF [Chlamydia felis]BAE81600.1 protein export proteins SecD/SecF fusion [Chlamydia felis Fe/C-56]
MKQRFGRNLSIIICVFGLALYYVLPTCLYYSRPLNKKIDEKEAQQIVRRLTKQVAEARSDIIPRVSSVLSALKLRGHITQHPSIPGVVNVHFKDRADAYTFLENMVYGEPTVPIKSSRLYVLGYDKKDGNVVQVTGSLTTALTEKDFSFVSYNREDTESGREILNTAAALITLAPSGACSCGYTSIWNTASIEKVVQLANNLASGLDIFPASKTSALLNYFFSSEKDYSAFLTRLENLSSDSTLSEQQQSVLRDEFQHLKARVQRWKKSTMSLVDNSLNCSAVSPFFSSIEFFAKERKLVFRLDPRVLAKRDELSAEQRLDFDSWLGREKQRLAHRLQKSAQESSQEFAFNLSDKDTSGKIVLHGQRIYQGTVEHLATLALNRPPAQSCDLIREHFPIYCRLPKESDSFGCFIFSPEKSCAHFSQGSVYVVLKGLRSVAAKYEKGTEEEAKIFDQDLQNLYNCFAHTDVTPWSIGDDEVLEIKEPLQRFFDVWGENFVVDSEGKTASLEVRDVRDRLETLNCIEKHRQEELVRWHEQYRQSSCSIDPQLRIRAAVPHRNAFLENLKLNIRKYSRGDSVLRLGIDFIGGKQIRLAFKDHQGKPIADKEDILKVSDELYARLNKLGVAEVEIRREGDNVYLSVPGSEKISSEEILGTSQMTFHVVNEKFSYYSALRYEVQRFLDYLWFTAQSQEATSPEAINKLASYIFNNQEIRLPTSVRDAITKLQQEGLAFPEVGSDAPSSHLDTTYSMIAIKKDREDKANPLMIVFRNYALDGASLKNIRPEFAISEGYILNFSVKDSTIAQKAHNVSPTESFHAWTAAYCQEGINGTTNSQYSSGRGWRMAVVLDGYVVSDPVLNAPLKDHASVSGKFSHREVNRLATDLKSGSMSFVPEVLIEEVISPELGKQQRTQGIISILLGLAVLIILMSVYYKFGGVIASGAVILNLLLIWAALQYLDAPLTLTGLAGIVLAMGMAVDANVLVFERIREEYVLSRSLSQSVEAGYKKAFGAIFDSNLTTVLASLLLLILDTGPIKGFALTLIIGIFSSMFTALFMTKFFFMVWMNKTQETQLHMMNKFIGIKHDFLRECKRLWMVSGSVISLGCVALGFGAWHSVLGMDFKGGYALTLNMAEQKSVDVTQFRHTLGDKFKQVGLSSRDFKITTFDSSEKIKIYFSQNALARVQAPEIKVTEAFDPHLSVVMGILSDTGIDISSDSFKDTQNFWFKVSSQFSNKMRKQAFIALMGALFIILLYVSLRFEWRYAFSAICALIHDLVATCAVLVATHFFLKKIQIDLQAVGALMTVLGYSLNNTLIIFDRIREDRQEKLFTPMPILINDALQKTLGRTVMTTATTLSVLLILLFVGGGSIFNFAFIMTIGILLGTLSSLYIAPPLLLFMVRKEERQRL